MKNILLVFIFVTSLLGQDFSLQIPGVDHDFRIPVDTCFRSVYLDAYAFSSLNPSQFETLEFHFLAVSSVPIEYRFLALTRGNYFFEDPADTLSFMATNHSSNDNLWLEEMEYGGDVLIGIRYLHMPGDSLSGFSLEMSADSSGMMREYLSFQVAADSLSNWLNFQPMAMGNIWKYSGPAPVFLGNRLEVIDTLSSGNRMYYTVVRQRQYYVEYGDDLVEDTVVVYTQTGNQHTLFDASGGYASPASSFLPAETYDYEYEGLVPQEDGSVDFGYWNMGSSGFWTHGIGYTSNWGDGFGLITRLTGYRINGQTSGNIELMVGIAPEPDTKPTALMLSVFPNPFNPTLTINYNLPTPSDIKLHVFDMKGSLVWVSNVESQNAGEHSIHWTASEALSSGVYFVQLNGVAFRQTQKVLLLK